MCIFQEHHEWSCVRVERDTTLSELSKLSHVTFAPFIDSPIPHTHWIRSLWTHSLNDHSAELDSQAWLLLKIEKPYITFPNYRELLVMLQCNVSMHCSILI